MSAKKSKMFISRTTETVQMKQRGLFLLHSFHWPSKWWHMTGVALQSVNGEQNGEEDWRMDCVWNCTLLWFHFFSSLNCRIIALHCCVGFCCTTIWISHKFTHTPLEPPFHLLQWSRTMYVVPSKQGCPVESQCKLHMSHTFVTHNFLLCAWENGWR